MIRGLLREIAANTDVVTVVLHERRSLPNAAANAIRKQRDHIDEVVDGILREGIDAARSARRRSSSPGSQSQG